MVIWMKMIKNWPQIYGLILGEKRANKFGQGPPPLIWAISESKDSFFLRRQSQMLAMFQVVLVALKVVCSSLQCQVVTSRPIVAS